MMTLGDLYVACTLLSVVLSVAVLAGWSIDCWPEWRARHEAFMRDADCSRFALRQTAMWRRSGTVFRPWNDPSPIPLEQRRLQQQQRILRQLSADLADHWSVSRQEAATIIGKTLSPARSSS